MTEALSTIADTQRAALLEDAIAREVMAGANVLSRSGFEAVMDAGIKTSRVKHFIFAVWTSGIGLIPWYRATTRSTPRYSVAVDEFGRAWSIAHGEHEWSALG